MKTRSRGSFRAVHVRMRPTRVPFGMQDWTHPAELFPSFQMTLKVRTLPSCAKGTGCCRCPWGMALVPGFLCLLFLLALFFCSRSMLPTFFLVSVLWGSIAHVLRRGFGASISLFLSFFQCCCCTICQHCQLYFRLVPVPWLNIANVFSCHCSCVIPQQMPPLALYMEGKVSSTEILACHVATKGAELPPLGGAGWLEVDKLKHGVG